MEIRESGAKLSGDFFTYLLCHTSIFFNEILQVSTIAILSDNIIVFLISILANQLDNVRMIGFCQCRDFIHQCFDRALGFDFPLQLLDRVRLPVFEIHSEDLLEAARAEEELLDVGGTQHFDALGGEQVV
jgi:hypothetical protein